MLFLVYLGCESQPNVTVASVRWLGGEIVVCVKIRLLVVNHRYLNVMF